jgi:dienelactone hydrolase
MHARFLSLFVLILALGLGACSTDTSSAGAVPPAPLSGTYRDVGPFEAGVTTLTLADRMVEVWYPVNAPDVAGMSPVPYFIRDELSDALQSVLPEDVNPPFPTAAYRDARASGNGSFPLVIFAHGSSSYRNQSTFLTTHLASWGFVVASVDYLERGLVSLLGPGPEPVLVDDDLTRMVVALMAAENEREGGPLKGRVSSDQIAITGHSAGGGTSIRFGGDPEVVTYIPLSAGISSESTFELPDKPSLWIAGNIDGVVSPERTANAFAEASAPARHVVIDAMGHLGPSDICAIGENGGGVIQIALDEGLPIPDNLVRLGTDGCQEGALPPPDGWPVINHFVTAQLRWAFGFDEEPVGLSQDVADDFPEAEFTYEESLWTADRAGPILAS